MEREGVSTFRMNNSFGIIACFARRDDIWDNLFRGWIDRSRNEVGMIDRNGFPAPKEEPILNMSTFLYSNSPSYY